MRSKMDFFAELAQDLLALGVILTIFVYYYALARKITMKEVFEEFKENLDTLDGVGGEDD